MNSITRTGKSVLPPHSEGRDGNSVLPPHSERRDVSLVLPPHSEERDKELSLSSSLRGRDGNSVLPPHSEGRSSGCTAGFSTNTESTGHSPAILGATKALTPSTGSRLCTLGEPASGEGSTWWIHTTCKAIIDDTGV